VDIIGEYMKEKNITISIETSEEDDYIVVEAFEKTSTGRALLQLGWIFLGSIIRDGICVITYQKENERR
jgi:hypothetical protein